ncbi:MAG: hypothetical protein OXC92_06700 [Flavobacteriaceae bacterium]|nr:hypothetical protein [Flavobacteriaceae bacterium]
MKFLGVLLILIGVVVGLQFVLEPILYASTRQSPYSPTWKYVNYAMILAILIGLIVTSLKRHPPENSSQNSGRCTRKNIQSIGFIVIALLFTWNYAQIHNHDFAEMATTQTTREILWVTIDVSLILLSVSLGKDLLR